MKLDVGGDGLTVPVVAGQHAASASVPVVIASDQSAVPISDNGGSVTVDGAVTVSGIVNPTKGSTGTISTINDTATSTTLLAANGSRVGGTLYNDSSAVLYVLWGSGTASASNYSVRLYSSGYVEIPVNYTGVVTGVWATDPNDGACRVTEF